MKNAFKKYLDSVVPAVGGKIVAVETMDHPSDAEIVAFARKYFVHADRMLG